MNLLKPFLLINIFLFSAPIIAEEVGTDADICTMARANLIQGGPPFEEQYNQIVQFLKREHVPYIKYGRSKVSSEGFESGSCLDVYGGCGADLFTIDPNLEADEDGHPSVVVIPKSTAQESGGSYYIVGKLEGLIWHKACGNDTEYVNGHVWTASFDPSELSQKVNQGIRVHTSISKAGHMVAKDYDAGNTLTFDDGTIIVSTKDFESNPSAFSEFLSLYQPLTVYQR